jgi:DNA-binding transcriptional LysR family regulator
VRVRLVDGSSDHFICNLASSEIDVAFVADSDLRWNGKSLSVWNERLVVALPDSHPSAGRDTVHWHDLRNEPLLLPQHGPGPEFLQLLCGKIGCSDARDFQQHDVSLDRLLTLVGAGLGILLALEGATGASYPGVVYREVHDDDGPTRLGFRAIWRQENCNPSLRCLLDILRERYPDFSAEPTPV